MKCLLFVKPEKILRAIYGPNEADTCRHVCELVSGDTRVVEKTSLTPFRMTFSGGIHGCIGYVKLLLLLPMNESKSIFVGWQNSPAGAFRK